MRHDVKERRMVGSLGEIGIEDGKDSCVQRVIRSGVGADKGLSIGRKGNFIDTLSRAS